MTSNRSKHQHCMHLYHLHVNNLASFSPARALASPWNVFHGKSPELLAPPRNTKDRENQQSERTAANRHWRSKFLDQTTKGLIQDTRYLCPIPLDLEKFMPIARNLLIRKVRSPHLCVAMHNTYSGHILCACTATIIKLAALPRCQNLQPYTPNCTRKAAEARCPQGWHRRCSTDPSHPG